MKMLNQRIAKSELDAAGEAVSMYDHIPLPGAYLIAAWWR